MAILPPHLLSVIFLVLISPIAQSIRDLPKDYTPSSFHFFNDLKNCQKGTTAKGLNKLKNYLKRFGYLNYQNQTHVDDNDYFDDSLERALLTYQENFNLPLTGTLDASTMSKMALPRCGVPDVINGVNTMQKKSHHSSPSKSIHTVAHYVFFPNAPRWPPSKTQLTYSFDETTIDEAKRPVASAFNKWASATQYFTFSQVEDIDNSDLVIGFYSGDHGDGSPFDGPGRIVAHAFAPTNGRLHYDADETWGTAPDPSAIDLESVALHEIGHLLGLGHSLDVNAVMHPGIAPGEARLDLTEDDIDGINDLYDL